MLSDRGSELQAHKKGSNSKYDFTFKMVHPFFVSNDVTYTSRNIGHNIADIPAIPETNTARISFSIAFLYCNITKHITKNTVKNMTAYFRLFLIPIT